MNEFLLKAPSWQNLPVSVDLESMGLDFDAPIFAIGAVRFNPDGSPLPEGCPGEFYRLINLNGQGPADINTLYWWLQQSPEAQTELKLSEKAHGAINVLSDFRSWLLAGYLPGADSEVRTFEGEVWVRGDRDSAWLEHLYKRVIRRALPYRYHKVRDQRTLLDFAQHHLQIEGLWEPRETPLHHALYDARYQAECIQKVLKGYPNYEQIIEPE